MTIQYISSRITDFFHSATSNSQDLRLIFGDEVNTTGTTQNGRSEVLYRERMGWVRTNHLMENHPLELYYVDVGQGDCTFIVTPEGRKILVDGGCGNEAFQFLVWKYRLDAAGAQPVEIDLLVLTHTDEDHVGGLTAVVAHPLINIQKIVHSGIAKFDSSAPFNTQLGNRVTALNGNDYLTTRHSGISELNGLPLDTDTMIPWVNAVQNSGAEYEAVDSTTETINVGDSTITLHVLSPVLENVPPHGSVYRWFSSEGETVNGHSVICRLDIGAVRILLPGDLNDRAARYLLTLPNFAGAQDAHVFKAPHHGSHKFAREYLVAVNPQISVVSSGETPDHGHPRANFLGIVGQTSRSNEPLLFSTELVALFEVDNDAVAPDADDPVDPTDASMIGQARRRFKKRLNGIINVRTDGTNLYAARRVSAGYRFVTYGPITPSPRTNL